MLARKVLAAGQRLLIVSADANQRESVSKELWRAGPEEFLANADGSRAGAEKQPILLSERPEPANGASMILLADGKWRDEARQFDRALLLFGPDGTDAARALWRELDGKDDVTREIHKQDDSGNWRAGA